MMNYGLAFFGVSWDWITHTHFFSFRRKHICGPYGTARLAAGQALGEAFVHVQNYAMQGTAHF